MRLESVWLYEKEYIMKILKKPDVSNWKAILSCKDCLAELEVYASDLKYTPADISGPYEPGSSESFTITCAVCATCNYIEPSKIDSGVKALLRKGIKIYPHKEDVDYTVAYYNK
jgi:hypothetical protein